LFESFLGGGNSNIFFFHPLLGEMIQFDEHIFQMGWFNHQAVFFTIYQQKKKGGVTPNSIPPTQTPSMFALS